MRKIISLAIISLVIGIQAIYAQTPSSQSPASGIYEEWSSDSQIFVYQNTAKNPPPHTTPTNSEVFKTYPAWEAFNPQTGGWFETNIWPLYPNLSSAESTLFQTQGFIITSPDGQLLIYPSLQGKVTLANRSTQQILETDIDFLDPIRLPIQWSEDSLGFSVEGAAHTPDVFDPIIYYVRIHDRLDLTQTQIYLVSRLDPIVIGNRVFSQVDINRIFDVQQHQVLTTMSDLTSFRKSGLRPQEAQSHVVIWNPENPEASLIIDAFDGTSLRGAIFAPNEPQRLMLILGIGNVGGGRQRSAVQPGLYTYDLQTHGLQFLAAFDGYSNIDYPYFSPDGNWLALRNSETITYDFFRTSDLLALPPLAQPTAFPTLTPPPTYTMTPYETPTPTHTPTRQG